MTATQMTIQEISNLKGQDSPSQILKSFRERLHPLCFHTRMTTLVSLRTSWTLEEEIFRYQKVVCHRGFTSPPCQASDSEVLNRIQIKKVKQAKATAAFSKAAAATPHRESRDVVARPSSVPISVNSGVPSTGPTKAVHKLTPEERRTRIAKFMDKRTRRRWGRKVEYECRKKLAVQRVRIHGRFA